MARRDPERLPDGDATFHRETTIHPNCRRRARRIWLSAFLAGYAYHLNVMPLDARMPDAGMLVRAYDITIPARTQGFVQVPVVVFEDDAVRVQPPSP